MPGCFRPTCSDYARMLLPFCIRGCGCNWRPAFPAPSALRGTTSMQSSGMSCRENAKARHCEEQNCRAGKAAAELRGARPRAAGGPPLSLLHSDCEAVSRVRSHISPGPYRSFRELSLAGSVDPDIWCPPTFVGNSGIECSNGERGLALFLATFNSDIRHRSPKARPSCEP